MMTPKQAIFYGEYIKDGNGTRAAIAAGYPEKSAHVAAARMLKNPQIAGAIAEWQRRTCTKLELTAELVQGKIVAVLRADPKNLYDGQGNRIPVHLLDDVTRAAIAAIEDETQECLGDEDEEGIKPRLVMRKQKLKLCDGLRAAELGGKLLKLFTERAEVVHRYGQLGDEDLAKRIDELAASLGFAPKNEIPGRNSGDQARAGAPAESA
jgi:phage terminase small subunit